MKTLFKILLATTLVTMLFGCAARYANLTRNERISRSQKNVIVFPFRNAYYKGRELVGVGTGFSSTFVSEVTATDRNCRLVENNEFNERTTADVLKACEHARQQGADVVIIGTVNEWLDGATHWSGKVDVVSVTVFAYQPATCQLITSANGRESGRWFTFVNAPATRFYKTLSQDLVATMFE